MFVPVSEIAWLKLSESALRLTLRHQSTAVCGISGRYCWSGGDCDAGTTNTTVFAGHKNKKGHGENRGLFRWLTKPLRGLACYSVLRALIFLYLQYSDFGSLWAFLAWRYDELNALAFLQRFETGRSDLAEVSKYVRA